MRSNVLVAMKTRTVALAGKDKSGMQAQERLKEGTMDQQGLSHGQAHTPLFSLGQTRLTRSFCCYQAAAVQGRPGSVGRRTLFTSLSKRKPAKVTWPKAARPQG